MTRLIENLVALIYSPKHCSYPEVVPINIPGLEINIKKLTWTYLPPGAHPSNHPPRKIGECDSYSMRERSSGVIGVYDRTENSHLTSIARDWHEFQEDKHRDWHNVD